MHALLLLASYLQNILGKDFIRGLEKITAIVLATVAVEMTMAGIKAYFFELNKPRALVEK